MVGNRNMDKVLFKKKYKKCAICEESNYPLLDVHRIEEGKDYSESNCVVLCVKCHRLHHHGTQTIKSKRQSTGGTVLIFDKNGEEQIKFI